MTPEQILFALTALIAGEPNTYFDSLGNGGLDPRYPVTIETCDNPPGVLEVEGITILCGVVDVPENYDLPEGNRIGLEFAILGALSQSPAPDPVIYLHGGPASGTLDALGPINARLFGNQRRTRDIVTFDQRAAALSSRSVQCFHQVADNILDLVSVEIGLQDAPPLDKIIAPCIEEIKASGADLSAYNTTNNARDVAALMSALGYERYNLYGISYGTRLALEVLRTAPEGVRSAVIDGVAAPTERIYDDLLVPYADALDALVAQCANDTDCNAAYPDLGRTINAAFAYLDENPVPASRGMPAINADLLFTLTFPMRNSWRDQRVITPYLPRIFTELSTGDTTTIDALFPSEDETRGASLLGSGNLTTDETALLTSALEITEAMTNLDAVASAVIGQLRANLATDTTSVSVARAFEDRSNRAALAITDRQAMADLLRDYALLQRTEPSREALTTWVETHFTGRDRVDLLALVSAMSEDDIALTFAIADDQATLFEGTLGSIFNVAIYACQEDVPWNSPEGFATAQADIATRYPFLDDPNLRAFGDNFYSQCAHFEHHDRDGFHTPIETDIPVLALNGLLDIQTSYHWGANAIAKMTNARNLTVPEAGHGTIAYQPCANDISVAFLNHPDAELDVSCLLRIVPEFILPR